MKKSLKISIPKELCRIIDEKIKGTQYKNIQDYVIDCIKRNLRISNTSDLDKDEEAKIKERLKSLGYL